MGECFLYGNGGVNTSKKPPVFTYTGDSVTLMDDKGWRIKFLTSGTLRFQKLNSADAGIDVFLVGGGGGGCTNHSDAPCGQGGGGGYTNTIKQVAVTENTDYPIVIGAGGVASTVQNRDSDAASGGKSSAFNIIANGGEGGHHTQAGHGGNGGSGGGASHGTATNSKHPDNGGSDGSDGVETLSRSDHNYGIGQHTTTREFAEPTGDLYAGGGGAGNSSYYGVGGEGGGGDGGTSRGVDGSPNTGGGGGGGGRYQSSGGSGIVVIRNKRG